MGKLKLIDLFDIETGKDLIYSSLEEGEYNVVGQSATNNSVVGTTQALEDYKLYKANSCITLAHIGNFYATVQSKDFYLGTRVKALIPKFQMSKLMLLLYASYINLNSYRFSYGRVGGSRVEDLEIPDLLESLCFLSVSNKSGAEQSRAEQSRAEQSRAEQSRAEQSRAEQSNTLWGLLCYCGIPSKGGYFND